MVGHHIRRLLIIKNITKFRRVLRTDKLNFHVIWPQLTNPILRQKLLSCRQSKAEGNHLHFLATVHSFIMTGWIGLHSRNIQTLRRFYQDRQFGRCLLFSDQRHTLVAFFRAWSLPCGKVHARLHTAKSPRYYVWRNWRKKRKSHCRSIGLEGGVPTRSGY